MIPEPTETDLRRNIEEDYRVLQSYGRGAVLDTPLCFVIQSYIRLLVAERKLSMEQLKEKYDSSTD